MLSSSITAGDLVLTNVNGGAMPTVQSVLWDSSTKMATFSLSTPIVDNYTASLGVGSVSSVAGIAMPLSYSLPFFSLPGDANHDRTVNLLDLNALATNYGKSGMNFTRRRFSIIAGRLACRTSTCWRRILEKILRACGFRSSFGRVLNEVSPQAESAKLLFASTPILGDSLDELDELKNNSINVANLF